MVGAYVHIHNKYKVSVTIHVDMRANQIKVSKLLPFENEVRITKYLMCILGAGGANTKYEVSISNLVPGGGVHRC